MGGHNGNGRIAGVQAFDLEDAQKTCNQISPFPFQQAGVQVGVVKDVVKVCGGSKDSQGCYDYHPESNTWVNSTRLTEKRFRHGASFIDNQWFISGGKGPGVELSTTESLVDLAFVRGPDLPRGMKHHCQLTVDETHVFFATADGQPSYLLDWPNKTWTELDGMYQFMDYPSCGLIKTHNGYREVVMAGYGDSEIFSLRSRSWRYGPPGPYFFAASSTQLSDTFLVVGGIEISGTRPIDTIYKFDNIKYNWIRMEQHLDAPSNAVGVATVPDSFVHCTIAYSAFNSKYA